MIKFSLIYFFKSSLKFFEFSNVILASLNFFATIVLMTVIGIAHESLEPTILNSNLFPVNAKGEVLFLSATSLYKSRRPVALCLIVPMDFEKVATPSSTM